MGLKVMAGLTKSNGKYNDQMQMNFFIYISADTKTLQYMWKKVTQLEQVALAIISQS